MFVVEKYLLASESYLIPVKYESDVQEVTSVLMILKNWEISEQNQLAY